MRISDFVTRVFLAFILFVPFSLFGQVTFETFDQYTFGPSPTALAAGDFNNDGWPDIVASHGSHITKNVSLALNNKAGKFSNIINITALRGYQDLATGFFNGDANLDFIAASNTLDQITIFLGNGNGTFIPTNIASGDGPIDIELADLNEDTKLDIVVINQSSNDIYIYYGDGMGGVSAPQIIAAGFLARSFTIADFNNDTHLDLVVGVNTNLDFFAGDGMGGFAAPTSTGGFSGFDYIGSADVDDDGNKDVIAASGSSLAFTIKGNGNGTFSGPAFLPVGGSAYITGDFDTDGNLDAVTTRQGKFIFYPGDGSGTFPEYRRIHMESGGRAMVAADWDKDGNLDLALGGTFSSSFGFLQTLFGKGDGNFRAQFEYPAPNNPRGLASEDFNEDGFEDLALVADGKLQIYLGQSKGTFVKTTTQPAGTFPYDVEALHFNADTNIDLAVLDLTDNSVNLFSGDGTGIFTLVGNFSVVANFEMTIGDVNKDDISDIIIAGGAANNIQIFKGNGNETFSLLIDLPIGESVRSVLVADVNEDTNPDLAILYNPALGPSKLGFYQGDGVGGFIPVGAVLDLSIGGATFTKEDFNNDGHIDFLSLASGSDIFTGNGDFTFTHITTNIGVFLTERSTEVKDIDGDGIKDLISGSDCSFCSNGGVLQVNRGIGDGTFSAAFWLIKGVGGYRQIIADFNNDGKNDIANLVNNTNFDGLSISLNTSGPPPCDVPNITVNPVSTSLCIGGADYVLVVNATGTAPLTYQWQKDGVNIPGAVSSPSYTLSNYTQVEAGTYRCIVTNNCGNDTSAGATITINSAPSSPEVVDATDCAPASVELMATGSTDGNYRWYTVQVGGTALAGEVNGSFVTPILNTTTNYYVSITNGTCESGRSSVTATILTPVAITTQPSNSNANFGEDITFTVAATGSNLNYQWQKDGADLSGKTMSLLLIASVEETDQGGYACTVSNDCNSVLSNEEILTVIVTNIDEYEPNAITVYPNPSNGQFQIGDVSSDNMEINVFSAKGDLLFTKSLNSSDATLYLSDLPNGAYYLLIDNRRRTVYKKILIRR